MTIRFPMTALALAAVIAGCSQGEGDATARQTSVPAATVTPVSGACTQQGLTGIWSLQTITAAEEGVQDFYRQHPVEYLRFTADGKYDYVAMNTPLPGVAEATASLDRADAGDDVTYAARMLGGGMLMIYRDGSPWQGFMCTMDGPVMVWTEMQSYPKVERRQVRVR